MAECFNKLLRNYSIHIEYSLGYECFTMNSKIHALKLSKSGIEHTLYHHNKKLKKHTNLQTVPTVPIT